MSRSLGKWKLPQPADIKEDNEWVSIPRIARTLPFGYKIDDDDPNYDAIMALCTDGVVNKSMMNAQQAILISAIQELSAKVTALENA